MFVELHSRKIKLLLNRYSNVIAEIFLKKKFQFVKRKTKISTLAE